MILKKIYIIFFFLAFYICVNAQSSGSTRPQIFVFEDKAGIYDIQKILLPETLQKFKPAKKDIPSFSFTQSVIWLKVIVKKQTDEDLYLNVRPHILNTVVFYNIYKNGNIDSIVGGTLHKVSMNKDVRDLLFHLSPDATAYYLKIKTNTRLYVDLTLLSKENIIDNKSNFLINGIYAGILLMIFIYNLFLFLSSSDRIYFYYLLHLFANFVNFLYLSGIGIKYIWTKLLWVNEYFIAIMSFGFVFSVWFIIKFLDTKQHSKPLHSGMLISIGLFLIIGLSDLSGFHLIAAYVLNIIGFLIILFTMFASVLIFRQGHKHAAIFLFAWIFYFIGTSIQVLQGLNVLPSTLINSNAMLIGSAFEITLLSLSIGYRMSFLKKQLRTAAVNEKKALFEKEKLMKEESQRLELLANEKTKLIQEKNNQLKKQHEDILIKNKKIKRQNEILKSVHLQLETKNRIIEEQYELLLHHKNNLEDIIAERTVALKKAVEKAKEADEIKTAFLRNISHEIRTPMNAIAGFSNLLLNIDTKDHRNEYYKNVIFKNTENLLELINNIIDLSEIQVNRLELKKVKFRLDKLFNALYDTFRNKIKEQNKFFVSLKVSIPDDKLLYVNMDYNRLWQIIYHLLDNAIKYTDTGFVDFGFIVNQKQQLEIFVKDSGKGISTADIDTIFEQFRKKNKDVDRLYSGTGLGLSLVKGLVQLMNATVKVRSITQEEAHEKNHGTTFILFFDKVIVK